MQNIWYFENQLYMAELAVQVPRLHGCIIKCIKKKPQTHIRVHNAGLAVLCFSLSLTHTAHTFVCTLTHAV